MVDGPPPLPPAALAAGGGPVPVKPVPAAVKWDDRAKLANKLECSITYDPDGTQWMPKGPFVIPLPLLKTVGTALQRQAAQSIAFGFDKDPKRVADGQANHAQGIRQKPRNTLAVAAAASAAAAAAAGAGAGGADGADAAAAAAAVLQQQQQQQAAAALQQQQAAAAAAAGVGGGGGKN
jgi:hypothetical protein